MSETLQLVFVGALVLLALAFSLSRLARSLRGRRNSCCSDDSGGALSRKAIGRLPDCSSCSGRCSSCE